MAISADGKCIVSGGADKMVKVWDAATGKDMVTLLEEDAVADVAISADGKRIAARGVKMGKVWDATTGKEISHIHGQQKNRRRRIHLSCDQPGWPTRGLGNLGFQTKGQTGQGGDIGCIDGTAEACPQRRNDGLVYERGSQC